MEGGWPEEQTLKRSPAFWPVAFLVFSFSIFLDLSHICLVWLQIPPVTTRDRFTNFTTLMTIYACYPRFTVVLLYSATIIPNSAPCSAPGLWALCNMLHAVIMCTRFTHVISVPVHSVARLGYDLDSGTPFCLLMTQEARHVCQYCACPKALIRLRMTS